MKESFEFRRLTGRINITLSNKKKWSADKTTLCARIVAVVENYAKQGYTLTLRQLYYQLVASDTIPNDDTVYKKLSSILDDLRYTGMVDWDAIEDRGRVPDLPYYAENIPDAMDDILRAYRLDRQSGQDNVIEMWTEKDAISGILRRVTHEYHIRLVVNKGYSSSSAMYRAYRRLYRELEKGKRVTILYFGDHDPSGLDMVRDIKDRMINFLLNGESLDIPHNTLTYWYNHVGLENPPADEQRDDEDDIDYIKRCYVHEMFEVVPIGLTLEQIREYNPPPNPAKTTDSRSDWYIKEFGNESWEVDALSPAVMENIVRDAIDRRINRKQYEKVLDQERADKKTMQEFIKSL